LVSTSPLPIQVSGSILLEEGKIATAAAIYGGESIRPSRGGKVKEDKGLGGFGLSFAERFVANVARAAMK
jgi:hypothetical protein